MKAYSIHSLTKEFMGEVDCQLDPLESKLQGKEVYLIPGGCVKRPPPECKENEKQIFIDRKWKIVPDHRGKVFYHTETQQEIKIEELGRVPPKLTDIKPGDCQDWNGNKWVDNPEKIKARDKAKILDDLVVSDFGMIRAIEDLCEFFMDKIPQEVVDKINNRKGLRDKLHELDK